MISSAAQRRKRSGPPRAEAGSSTRESDEAQPADRPVGRADRGSRPSAVSFRRGGSRPRR